MENKKIIALDIDGVIADIVPEFAFRLKRDFGIDDDPYQWSSYRPAIEYAPTVTEDWVSEQLNDTAFWMNVQPYEDAWYMVNKWFMQGHDIYIVTARGEHHKGSVEATYKWFDEWEINYNHLYHSESKEEKYKTCLKLGADIFIEDNSKEAKSASEHVTTYLRHHKYNENDDIGKAIRIYNLYQLDRMVINVR